MRKLQKLLATFLVPGALSLTEIARGQDLDDLPDVSDIALLSQIIDWTGIVQAAVVILFAWLLLRFVDRIVEDLGKSVAERRLLLQRINAFFRFSVYLTTIAFIVLVSFDFSPRVLAVIGGASVVAVGFATRDLLASLVGGILIILDRPFQIGDRVKFGGEYGDIKTIGLRSVKLTTLDDSTVTIPNNLFLSEVTSSSNSGQLDMQTVVDFYIGLDQDVHPRTRIDQGGCCYQSLHLPAQTNQRACSTTAIGWPGCDAPAAKGLCAGYQIRKRLRN
jgi:small-conductance mechanosensitive channel